ncbi:MAG: MlaD family protein [Solirubrobacteraceae bacterium]|nr:MlaD family protein [Solirubrobacteraceae bacterium]
MLVALVYVSYTANGGIPGQSGYRLEVELPDAERLVRTNQVRMAGVRVGQVDAVEAIPARRDGREPATARVSIRLDADVDPLPVDTLAKVRPASILGSSYLDLVPGRSARTIPDGGTLPRERARANVELTDLLDVFDTATAEALQTGATAVGGALVGRGRGLGESLASLGDTARPAERVMGRLADPDTRLGPLVDGYERTVRPFGERRAQVGRGTRDAATTLTAIAAERPALGRIVDELPGTLSRTTDELRRFRPALDDLADISVRLRPAARKLPRALTGTNRLVADAMPALRLIPRTAGDLDGVARRLTTVSGAASTIGTIGRTADAIAASTDLLALLTPAQVHCNYISLFGRVWDRAFGTLGVGDGPALANITVKSMGAGPLELLQNDRPLSNLHANYNPYANADECEAGNEPYSADRQLLTNPPGHQSRETLRTEADPKVVERARRAGLTAEPPEAIR